MTQFPNDLVVRALGLSVWHKAMKPEQIKQHQIGGLRFWWTVTVTGTGLGSGDTDELARFHDAMSGAYEKLVTTCHGGGTDNAAACYKYEASFPALERCSRMSADASTTTTQALRQCVWDAGEDARY